MVRLSGWLLHLPIVLTAAKPTSRDASIGPAQVILDTSSGKQQQIPQGRRLKGKFLHITDFHPDPFYQIGAAPKGPHPCHKGTGNNHTTFYGAPTTDCDSPFTLVEATFSWIKEHIKDEIDFVIWTGDSARHDNDIDIPRSDEQVLQLNKYITDKFVEVFGNTDDPNSVDKFIIPIVPTLGNNDILPHNIFAPGPNKWSESFANIWEAFIPQDQVHSFARGGWFSVEVIPDKLAVINLNTLYFFSSNAAVDGCELETEPGYEHFEWLRVQLQDLRERGMKAYLIGHIPPARTKSKRSWDETCYQKYLLWHKQYKDVIIASLYGHMNIDHFMFHDTQELMYRINTNESGAFHPDLDELVGTLPDNRVHIQGKAKYLNQLRQVWSDLPTPPKGMQYDMPIDSEVSTKKLSKKAKKFLRDIGGPYAERFTMSMVSPSVVPNYFPTLRIVEYNITGLEQDTQAVMPQKPKKNLKFNLRYGRDHTLGDTDHQRHTSEDDVEVEGHKKGKKHGKKKKSKWPRKPNFPIPDPPSSTSAPGPAHSPQTLSLVSWTQMYANLTEIHENMVKDGVLFSDLKSENAPRDMYKYFEYKVEYNTDEDDAYKMPDLTVRSWLSIGEKIGRTVYEPIELDTVYDLQNITSLPNEFINDGHESDEENEDNEEEDDEEEEDNDDEEDDVDGDEVGIDKKGKHGKHKKHKHKGSGQLRANHLWHDFLKRAYTGAKHDKWLRKHFD